MARFIDPAYDTAFKLIFGQENSKELLLDFLNDLLEGEKKIKELRFLDKERMPMYRKGRRGIHDIACRTEEWKRFSYDDQAGFFCNRAIPYWVLSTVFCHVSNYWYYLVRYPLLKIDCFIDQE